MLRKLISWLLFAGLCLLTAGSPGLAAPPTPPAWQSKVDPWVLEETNRGQTEFILFLPAQADLSHAAALPTKLEKGRYVYETLTEVAGRTQGPLIATLKARGIEYRPYWVANMIWARGDLAAVQALAERADVAHVYANPTVKLVEPTQPAEARALAAPAAPDCDRVEHHQGERARRLGGRLQGPGYGDRGPGHRLPMGPSRAQEPLPRLGRHGPRPRLQLARRDPYHRQLVRRQFTRPLRRPRSRHPHHGHHGRRRRRRATRSAWRRAQSGSAAETWTEGVGTPITYAECYQWFMAPTRIDGRDADPAMAPDVINNSWGCPPSEGCTDPNVLLTVVQNVRAAGIVTVHSAGNSGSACGTVNTPPRSTRNRSVWARPTNTDTIAGFSSRGPVTVDGSNRLKPNVSAPGVSIRSSVPTAMPMRAAGRAPAWQGRTWRGWLRCSSPPSRRSPDRWITSKTSSSSPPCGAPQRKSAAAMHRHQHPEQRLRLGSHRRAGGLQPAAQPVHRDGDPRHGRYLRAERRELHRQLSHPS